MIIRTQAYPRAGLIGNPSDGYYGKTIAFCFRNFSAEVVLYQTPELEILPNERDLMHFDSIDELVGNVRQFGYYGGLRLLAASIARFHDYSQENGIELDDRNFTIRYRSSIPHQVGLAGSSAIITACFRALMAFYHLDIPAPVLANLILSVETDELGIAAGLQDRVAQVYECPVFMDFNRKRMDRQGYGEYQPLDLPSAPNLYIAYRTDLAEGSEIFHNDIRARFRRGDSEVLEAMEYWAGLADQAREALLAGNWAELGTLLDANFDRRATVYEISKGNTNMVEAARSVGASAKFSGSGGAVVGTFADPEMYRALEQVLAPMHIRIFQPELIPRRSLV